MGNFIGTIKSNQFIRWLLFVILLINKEIMYY